MQLLSWKDERFLERFTDSARAKKLSQKAGISTVGDALLHFPAKYIRAGSTGGLDDLTVGNYYTCIGQVTSVSIKDNYSGKGPRKLLVFTFTDGEHDFTSTIFGYPGAHTDYIAPGALLLFYGKLDTFMDQWQLKNPSYITIQPGPDVLQDQKFSALDEPERKKKLFGAFGALKTIVDITGDSEKTLELLGQPYLAAYPRRVGTTSPEMLALNAQLLKDLPDVPEIFPTSTSTDGKEPPEWPVDPSTGKKLISFNQAIRQIHSPDAHGPDNARARIKFMEALQLQIVMALRRADSQQRIARPIAYAEPGAKVEKTLEVQLINSLPFTLNSGQEEALDGIRQGMSTSVPLNALLQGDVGAGKTVVALISMLRAIENGQQAALLAPTEILVQQHARSFMHMLEDADLDIPVTVLTSSMDQSEKQQAMLDIMSGEAQLVVGTHALIQESVQFMDLGLAVVDEQHRFGVEQRDALRERNMASTSPHMLYMTATPIPRTVAMSYFGDLDTIVMSGLPTGRGNIMTSVVPEWKPQWLTRAFLRIREEVQQGHQAFVVAPSIDGEQGVYDIAEKLSTGPLQGLRIGVVHSKLPTEQKDEVMKQFVAGNLDVLVSTTVVEVGVDVPNATVMFVVHADHFGISQLHQLRGRIGRGSADSYCLLHTEKDQESPSYARLRTVADTRDGFVLAEQDLQSRAEGDILGNSQSGTRFKRTQLLDLSKDAALIEAARRYAQELVHYDDAYARSLVEGFDTAEQDYIERS